MLKWTLSGVKGDPVHSLQKMSFGVLLKCIEGGGWGFSWHEEMTTWGVDKPIVSTQGISHRLSGGL